MARNAVGYESVLPSFLRRWLGIPIEIEIERIPSNGPEWIASIPGTGMRGYGWSDEAAIGNLMLTHRSYFGFILKAEREDRRREEKIRCSG